MSIVKDMSLAPSGRQKIQWVRDFMPALSGIEERFRREKPFAGLTIAVSVHLEAKKLGLKGIPRSELPKFKELAPKLYLLLPLVILVWLVSTGKNTMAYSAAIAIFIAIAVGAINIFVNKACGFEDASDNISLMKVLDALGNEIELKDEDEDAYQPVRDDYYDREDDFGYQADDDFASAGGFTFKGDSDDDDLTVDTAEEEPDDALFAEDDYN